MSDVQVHLLAATRHNRKHMFGATPASVPPLCMAVKTLSQESRSQTITWVSVRLFPPGCRGWNSFSICLLHMGLVLGMTNAPITTTFGSNYLDTNLFPESSNGREPVLVFPPPPFLVCFSIKKLKLPIEPPEMGVRKLCFWFTRINGVLSFFHSFACVTQSALS